MDVCEPALPKSRLPTSVPSQAGVSDFPQKLLNLIDARRKWFFLAILLLYALGFNGQWRIERDSALYLTIGRNIFHGHGYSYQGRHESMAYPGLPFLFAGTSKLFRTDDVLPDLVVMFLLGFACLALTYRLFLLSAGRPTAVLMTIGLAASRLFYRYCFELLTDLPFLMGVLAFLVGYEAVLFAPFRSREGAAVELGRPAWFDCPLLIAGLMVAVVMRPAMWILILAVILATGWNIIRHVGPSRAVSRHLLLAVLIIAAGAIFFFSDPRRGTSGVVSQYEYYLLEKFSHPGRTFHDLFIVNLPELCESALAKALFGCPIGPGINTLAAILVVALSCWLLWYRTLWGLFSLATIGTLLIFKPLDRYMLPVIPLLIFAWWYFLLWLHKRLPVKWADLALLALLIAGISTNLARLGQMVVEQRRVPFLLHYHDGRYVSLHQLENIVRKYTKRRDQILVGPKVGRILTYVGHRTALRASNDAAVDPSVAIYALIGPSWDEDGKGKVSLHEDTMVPRWVAEHGCTLGPQIGPAIQNRPEKCSWTLHRVIIGPASKIAPPARPSRQTIQDDADD